VPLIAVTGSASGIGRAVRTRLEADGARVVGVDLRDAEIVADLATPAGRAAAVAAVDVAAAGRLDGLVACAGVGPHVEPCSMIVSLNYFGAQAVLAGLRPALAQARGAAVAISSNSSTLATLAGTGETLVAACLAGDEAEARRLAETEGGVSAYAGGKLALARWVRRNAPGAAWAGAGVRLNAVAPGPIQTPLLEAGLAHPTYGAAIRAFPVPLGGTPGRPEQVAAAVVFLLGPEAGLCCGSVLFVDGGTDAMMRPDQY
jgi:NAD(P)-dependent dehydrogenase (short-subunit alcohol dehydrogenase family)